MCKKRLLGGSFNKVILLVFQRMDVMDVMDADENVGLFGVFSSQAASYMEARKGGVDKAVRWVLDARKSEDYKAAKTHVSRLLAQVRRSRITKGLFEVAERYDRSEHECPWFMDLLYDLIKDVMQVKQQQQQQRVVQGDDSRDSNDSDSNDSNSCDSTSCDSTKKEQDNQEDSTL